MKNLKIRTKLLLQTVFLLIGLVAVGITSLMFMGNINDGSTEISQNWLPSVIAAEELNTLTSDYRISEFEHIVAQDSTTMQACEQEMADIEQQIQKKFSEYDLVVTNDTDRQLIASAKQAWSKYLELHDQMITLSRDNKTQQATELIRGESQTLFESASEVFLDLVTFNTDGGEQASLEGDELYASARTLMIVVIILISVLALLLSLYIIRAITKPVNELDNVAAKIADGNLNESITYTSKDELGQLAVNFNKTVTRLKDYVNYIDEISAVLNEIANGNLVFKLTYDYAGEFAKVKTALNHISDSLNETMGQINQASEQVSSGSEQVSTGAQALSQGATEQASSIEELAASINDISTQVNGNAEHAKQASEKAQQVGEQMTASNQQMQRMTTAMDDISNSSREIGKIIKTIEDIAFQTNILALNAAVEAARAGAAGKGFAVVADEVRNLAGKSSEASKNTAVLIESSIKAVENGTVIADETAKAMLEAVSGAKEVTDTINRISEASTEQAKSISQVTQGIDQISAVVQTNSATAEESAAASEELSGQAQILKSLVGRFKLKESGGSETFSTSPSAPVNRQPEYDIPDYSGSSKY